MQDTTHTREERNAVPEKRGHEKTHIDYPCNWSYKIIGTDEQSLIEATESIVRDKPYDIERSHTSSGGKYISMHVSVMVFSKAERLDIFAGFEKSEAVRVVI